MLRYIIIASIALLALVAPVIVYPIFLMQALCFAIFASAFNLVFGYAGLLSFGHAAFFGAAAYITGYVVKTYGLTPEIGIILGAAVAAALGLIIGVVAIKRQGIYFAMITFALAEVVNFIALEAPFTGGEDGLQSVPRGYAFGLLDLNNPFCAYYFVLGVYCICMWFIYRIVHSPFGHALRGIKDNEARATSLGYKANRYKLLAFVLSAFFSGVAGGTKTIVMQFASLTDIHWHMSGEVVLMTLLGGLGTMWGPTAGAVFVTALYNGLAEFGEWVTFIIGATFVVCVLLFRKGFVGELIHLHSLIYRRLHRDSISRSRAKQNT